MKKNLLAFLLLFAILIPGRSFGENAFVVQSVLGKLQTISGLTFFKDYRDDDSSLNANFAVGSPTATYTAARSSSAPATYADASGKINLLTTANVRRWRGGYYDSTGFHAKPGELYEGTASTNLVTYSNDVTNAAWTKTNLDTSSGDAPYVTNPGTLLEGFEDATEWTASGSGVITNDAVHYKAGTQGVKLFSTTDHSGTMKKTINLDLSSVDNFSLWFYVDNVISFVQIKFASTTNSSEYLTYSYTGVAGKTGWHHLILNKADFTSVGGESWSNTMIRLSLIAKTTTAGDMNCTFDNLTYSYAGKAKILLDFDDATADAYTKVYPIMAAAGFVGNIPTNVFRIDVLGNYMTSAELTTMYNAGWDIVNHGYSHLEMVGLSASEIDHEVNGEYDWLISHGFTRSAKFYVYGSGYNNEIIAKIRERHVQARLYSTIGNCHSHLTYDSSTDNFTMPISFPILSTDSVASIETVIDNCISKGIPCRLVFHQVADSAIGGIYYLTTDFQSVIDYIKTKTDAGLAEVVTYSQYYSEYGNAPDATAQQNIRATAADATVLLAADTATNAQTYSVFLKRNRGSGTVSITADSGATYTPVTLLDTWARFNVTATAATQKCGIKLGTSGDSVAVYGQQFENDTYPSSLIPTTTTSLTRPAESLKYVLSGNMTAAAETICLKFSPIFNATDLTGYPIFFKTDTKTRQFSFDKTLDTWTFGPNITDSPTANTNIGTTYGATLKNVSQVVCGTSIAATGNPNFALSQNGLNYTTNNTDWTENAFGTYFYYGVQMRASLEYIAIFSRALSDSEQLKVSNILGVNN